MRTIIGILFFATGTLCGKLTGDHVCQEEKRYTVNVTEYFIRNTTIRNYEWCLNVPPRCSFYTTRLVNDSRIVEKEVAHIIDKCCPGYNQDDITDTCIPKCPKCVNGTCVQGKCECFPGYKGNLCDKECDTTEWGKNCQFQCECQNKAYCDPKSGKCTCPPGWTGNTCQLPCSEGFFGQHCREKCNCQICNHVTGECETIPTTTTTTTLLTTEEAKKTTKTEFFQFTNNGKFETDKNGYLSTTSVVTETETPTIGVTTEEKQTKILIETTPISIVTKSAKAKVNAKEVTMMTTGHPQEENYLKSDFDLPPVNKNDLVNGASAATAISVAVIIVALVIVATNHFIRSKKKMEEEKERGKGIPTVSVYAHSIFHTPLPEPPTFENPIFVAPLETNTNSEGQQRFETRVVCSMNFPTVPSKDSRDYLYDHPPSTGSYRAASIPEPPEMSPVTHGEPLYDEIPSGLIPTPVSPPPPSYKSASLYMNTCGKTRL